MVVADQNKAVRGSRDEAEEFVAGYFVTSILHIRNGMLLRV